MTIKELSELSELELKVLQEVKNTKRRKIIKKELALTQRGMARIFKKLKDGGLTKIQGFGGSGCTCTLSENQSYCDCDGNPYVGRFTVISDLGKNILYKTKLGKQ